MPANANTDPVTLKDRLRDALARNPSAVASSSTPHPADARVVELDVREDLRAGREPFSSIMAAVASLPGDGVLHLRATFEPAPLFAVLGKRGFEHESQEHASDDWSVWFWRPVPVRDETIVELDVRGLEPPEPLTRTLAALESLPSGHTLVQINARVPQLLFPLLAERGFACEVDESRSDRILVRIWHAADTPRTGAACSVA